jgi:hypothetical protein
MKPSPTDTVPAMLTPGEAVLNREAAELLGRGTIKKLNHAGVQMRQVPGYADGVTTVPVTQLAQANQQNIANARVEWQKTIDAKRARDAAGATTMTPVTSPQSTAASRLGGMKGYSASGPATSGGIYGDSTIGTPAASGSYLQQRGLVADTTPALEPIMNKPMSAPLGMSRQPAQQVDLMDQFKSGLGDEEIQGFANGGIVPERDDSLVGRLGNVVSQGRANGLPGVVNAVRENWQNPQFISPSAGDKAYVANREAGFGVVPAYGKAISSSVLEPAAQSLGNVAAAGMGIAKRAGNELFAVPQTQQALSQQPAPQQQPAAQLEIPAGAESTVRSPLAAPTPSYVQLDQPRESIPQPVAAQPAWGRQVDINDVQSGEGVMRNATGTYGYRQMPNGDLMKFDAQGNQVGKLGNVGSRQQAGGMRLTSYGAMTPVNNPLAYETERRMAERTAAAEEAKLARLEDLAMTGGGGDGTFEGMGDQKRIRRGAQAALGERMGMQRAQMGADTQREQMALTQRGYDQETQRAEAKIDADMQLAALRQAAEDERAASTNRITQDMNLGTLQAKQRELLIKESKQNNANRALKSAIDYYVASGMSRPESERRAYLEANRGSLKLEE